MIDIPRLAEAVQNARMGLRRVRDNRLEMVRETAGSYYAEEGAAKEVPCNLMGLYTSIVGRKMMANNPRVMLSVADQGQKPIVSAMERWANKEIERIHLANTLQRVVLDSLYSVGICKVALATPADAAAVSWNIRGGEPMAMRVDLDDFVFDIHARDFDEVSFIGHRFRVPREAALSMYGKKSDLPVSDDPMFNLEGDERINMIGRTYVSGQDEFEDMVDLWELYLPRHRLIVTLVDNALTGSDKRALDIRRWIGPDSGPYLILGMGTLPGNCMPKAPLQDLFPLHKAANRILRKLIRQADRYKKLTIVQENTEDGATMNAGNDGDTVAIRQPDKMGQTESGGPSEQLFQLFTALKELFSWLAGNLEIMGGLSAQSKTASQDEMLNQNSSASVSDMQGRVMDFVSKVIGSLCWFWHHDPFKMMTVQHSLPGLPDMSVMRRVSAAQRQQVRFEDMDVQVDPYSLPHSTPQQRFAGLSSLVTNVIAPMLPLLQQQGKGFDVDRFLALASKYLNQPDVTDIVTIQPIQQGGPPSPDAGPKMAPQTSREYIRRSIGGQPQTQAGKDRLSLNGMRQASSNGVHMGAEA